MIRRQERLNSKYLLVLTLLCHALLLGLVRGQATKVQGRKITAAPGASKGVADAVEVTVYGGPSLTEETMCLPSERITDSFWLSIHYNATIDSSSKTGIKGELVDSTHHTYTRHPEPIMINLSDNDPMLAWAKAMIGLCSGDLAYLVVPPELAYGDDGDGGNIPGGATLSMEIHIVTAHSDPEQYWLAMRDPERMFDEMDSDGDGKVTFEEMSIYLDVPEDYPNRDSFLRQHFNLSDYNRDGSVSLEEFKAILDNWQGIDEL